jgi:TRAP-type transport system small permease protein
MSTKRWTQTALKSFSSLTRVSAWIGYIATAFIVLIVFADVFGRFLLNKPLNGSFELVEQTMAVLSGIAIMYTTIKRGHVSIDLLFDRFSRRTRIILQSIFSFLGFVIWVVLAYQVYLRTMVFLKSNQTTGVLPLSPAPFLFIFIAAVLLCGLGLLIQALQPGTSEENMGKQEKEFNEP